ncbi:hypothetical protein EQZ23_15450 [Sphingomonas sp. UV9]|uniref:hypothetical protein n=1 Tax=Sphingomonas sp. UV9 TaxID=1851410 RepID=UPI000FFBB95A|nr:hypothetical protein [Sphingomonas sp. UV9]RXD03708.1 hypothetical protein EQZ23_15450 [Sphingomonas sp. UV9]
MFQSLSFRPAALLVASLGAVGGAAAPAFATGDKPISVTLPASVFKDDTSRVCMPRTILGRKADKTLPETICETRSEWNARGVLIRTK